MKNDDPDRQNNTHLIERRIFISDTIKAVGASALLAIPGMSMALNNTAVKSYSVQDIINIILKEIPGAPFPKTVDTIKSGSADQSDADDSESTHLLPPNVLRLVRTGTPGCLPAWLQSDAATGILQGGIAEHSLWSRVNGAIAASQQTSLESARDAHGLLSQYRRFAFAISCGLLYRLLPTVSSVPDRP